MADRRSQRDCDVQCVSRGRHECGVQQPEGWQWNCWEHWLSGRWILSNYIPFVVLSVLIFPELFHFVLCTENSQQWDWLSKRGSSLLFNHSTHSHQWSPLLSISKRKCVWDLPWRARSEKESNTRSIWRMRTWTIAMNNFQKCPRRSLPYSMPLISARLFLSQPWMCLSQYVQLTW